MAFRFLTAEDQKANVAIGDYVFDGLLDADVFGEDLAADGAIAAGRVREMMVKPFAGQGGNGNAAINSTQPVIARLNRPRAFRLRRDQNRLRHLLGGFTAAICRVTRFSQFDIELDRLHILNARAAADGASRVSDRNRIAGGTADATM